MGRINRANLKKTIYYCKRNGIRRTWYAVRERLQERKKTPYVWVPPAEEELEAQRRGWERQGLNATFSIIVPAYRTKPEYLEDLVESLRSQTYPKWEVILADATEDDSVEQALRRMPEPGEADFDGFGQDLKTAPGFSPGKIRYLHLKRNAGIAENTNQALPYAMGGYIGLLDHDDVLTPDALYRMAAAIREAQRRGQSRRCSIRMRTSATGTGRNTLSRIGKKTLIWTCF